MRNDDWMSTANCLNPNWVPSNPPRTIWVDVEHGGSRYIAVNKTTHRVRFESETESEVTIVIEPKE